MSSFIGNLERFNRKERYFLIGMALGNREFRLDPAFRVRLGNKYSLTIPGTAFVAMDYHLNWIFAAAALSFDTPLQGNIFSNKTGIVDGTQEDVDLVVAFEDSSGINHVIMLEAKGFTSFNNRQFEHKMNRIKDIFGEDGQRWQAIKPYFGLVSPRKSSKLRVEECPSWSKVEGTLPWFEMPLPDNRLILYRCDERGRQDKECALWTVK